jgi:hypothetical protein
MPKRYSAKLVGSDGDHTMLYVNGWMRRLEFYPRIGRPNIVISRPDKGVIWSLDPQTKTYSQAKLPLHLEGAFDPDTLYDWTEDGTEIIDGRKCRRFVGRYRGPKGPTEEVEICYVDARAGMRRRVSAYDEKGKLVPVMDYLNAKVGAPPRNIFDMPEGFKRAYDRRKVLTVNNAPQKPAAGRRRSTRPPYGSIKTR